MVIEFIDANGNIVQVSPDNPLPGSGGGGMNPDDFTATAPLSWDAGTQTLTIDLSAYVKTSELPKAGHVANADGTSTATLATSVDAIRDALVSAGLMASA